MRNGGVMNGVRVLLFDVDLTLINTGGAGSRAMAQAFEEIFGVANGFEGVPFAGRTDPAIIKQALISHHIAREPADLQSAVLRFREVYLRRLRRTVAEADGRVLPGVPALLTALAALPSCHLGLATGNFRDGAVIKLAAYGLWGRFADGAYGDEHEDRAALVALAMRRFQRAIGAPLPAQRFFVFGDSEHDVSAAMANGATAVGVATGHLSRSDLLSAGAQIAFDDLSPTASVLRAVLAH